MRQLTDIFRDPNRRGAARAPGAPGVAPED